MIYESGRITAKALQKAINAIRETATIGDVVCAVEDVVLNAGAEFAFPTSVALNNMVAHGEPRRDNPTVIEKSIVKVDAGASLDGWITDSAITVDLDGTTKLAHVCEHALKAVIEKAKAGMPIRDIGLIIETIVADAGYMVVANLGGHGIERTKIHTAPYIANITNDSTEVLREGHVYAIEPLISTGRGTCFKKPGSEALWEVEGSLVAHFEHSIYIHKNGNTVLTARY